MSRDSRDSESVGLRVAFKRAHSNQPLNSNHGLDTADECMWLGRIVSDEVHGLSGGGIHQYWHGRSVQAAFKWDDRWSCFHPGHQIATSMLCQLMTRSDK